MVKKDELRENGKEAEDEQAIEEDEEEPTIELVVVESSIPVSGMARMHKHSLHYLGIEEGSYVTVGTEEQSILVKAFGDLFIAPREISLRPKERKKLEVSEGDRVTVAAYGMIGGFGKRLLRFFRRKKDDEAEEAENEEVEAASEMERTRAVLEQYGVLDALGDHPEPARRA